MKKGLKIFLSIFLIVLVILGVIFYLKIKINSLAITKGVIVKVNEKSLIIYGTENVTDLYTVGFNSEEDIEFKQGQEVQIYFNGMVMESYPAQLGKVSRIKIIKEESEIAIPDRILRYCYSSVNNVEVRVSELTNKGITFTIIDKNELPYTYSNEYTLYKKVKNENYTGIGYKIGEDTENSTSGYVGPGPEYIMQEVEKNSNISTKDTVGDLVYNLPFMDENNKYAVKGSKIDWTPIYGELKDRRI